MKRVHLHLDEKMARRLAEESRRRGTTVSKLVRDALAKDRLAIIERLAGVWHGRTDFGVTTSTVRRLRRSVRMRRWTGRGGVAGN